MGKKQLMGKNITIILLAIIVIVFAVSSILSVNSTKVKLQAMQTKVAQAQTQVAQLQATIQAQAAVIATMPKLPIIVSRYKQVLLDKSIICYFKNTSNSIILHATATCYDRTLSKHQVFPITVEPGSEKKFGQAQGWAFHSGDKIVLHSDGYTDITTIVP